MKPIQGHTSSPTYLLSFRVYTCVWEEGEETIIIHITQQSTVSKCYCFHCVSLAGLFLRGRREREWREGDGKGKGSDRDKYAEVSALDGSINQDLTPSAWLMCACLSLSLSMCVFVCVSCLCVCSRPGSQTVAACSAFDTYLQHHTLSAMFPSAGCFQWSEMVWANCYSFCMFLMCVCVYVHCVQLLFFGGVVP